MIEFSPDNLTILTFIARLPDGEADNQNFHFYQEYIESSFAQISEQEALAVAAAITRIKKYKVPKDCRLGAASDTKMTAFATSFIE